MLKAAALALACVIPTLATPITTQYYQVLDDNGSPICDSRRGDCGAYADQILVTPGQEAGAWIDIDQSNGTINYFVGQLYGPGIYNGLSNNTVRYVYDTQDSVDLGRYKYVGGVGNFSLSWELFLLKEADPTYGYLTANDIEGTLPVNGCGNSPCGFPGGGTFNVPFPVRMSTHVSAFFVVPPGEVGDGSNIYTVATGQSHSITQNGQTIEAQLVPVPEPGSLLLLGPVVLLWLHRLRRRPY